MSRSAPVLISPSILSADFAALGRDVAAVTSAGADMIHVDVMDNHYVPNLTIGPQVVKALRPHSDLPFDVHLMVAPVDPIIPAFVDAGADLITVHPDAGPHLHRTLQTIKDSTSTRGEAVKAGVALNPGTPWQVLEPVIDMVDIVLVMSVNPGFGGQSFIPSSLPKIEAIAKLAARQPHEIILEVDGGVNPVTSRDCVNAGATSLVAGSAVFKGAGSLSDNIAALRPDARPASRVA